MLTYPSIKSWLAVQINSLKLIQDNQMAEKSDFWSDWSPNRPRWPPGDPPVGQLKMFKSIQMVNKVSI